MRALALVVGVVPQHFAVLGRGLDDVAVPQVAATLPATLVFYVSPHSLLGALSDAAEVLGAERRCCVAREVGCALCTTLKAAIVYPPPTGTTASLAAIVSALYRWCQCALRERAGR